MLDEKISQARDLINLTRNIDDEIITKTKLLTITSGKGGVGKSTFSANLAYFYAMNGYKTIVLDADIGLANMQVLLDIRPSYTLFDYINGKKNLDEIILDTGMLYYFSKNGDTAKNPTTDGGSVVWKNQPLGQITIPSLWYGVAIFTDAEGFDQSEYEYDVWGIIEKDETGKPYFEVWLDEDFSSSFLLSTYIDIQDSQWYTPTIGEDDAWLIIDPKSADYQVLSSDDEWGLMAQYHNGSLDIYHTFFGKDGGYADTRFFLREEGTGWNESVDPLPPSYQAYKQIYAIGN